MRIMPFVQRQVRRRLSLLALAGALSAGILGTSQVAFAQVTEVEVEVAPPAPRVEVIPVAPSPQHFWVHGYWGYGTAHYWVPGRYEAVRPGWAYSEARWAPIGHRWHFYPGRWYQR